jgi:hypothetical protein
MSHKYLLPLLTANIFITMCFASENRQNTFNVKMNWRVEKILLYQNAKEGWRKAFRYPDDTLFETTDPVIIDSILNGISGIKCGWKRSNTRCNSEPFYITLEFVFGVVPSARISLERIDCCGGGHPPSDSAGLAPMDISFGEIKCPVDFTPGCEMLLKRIYLDGVYNKRKNRITHATEKN